MKNFEFIKEQMKTIDFSEIGLEGDLEIEDLFVHTLRDDDCLDYALILLEDYIIEIVSKDYKYSWYINNKLVGEINENIQGITKANLKYRNI